MRLADNKATVVYIQDTVIHRGYITDKEGKRMIFPAIGYLISLFDQNGWKLVQYSYEYYYDTFNNHLFRDEYEYAIFYKKVTDTTQQLTFVPVSQNVRDRNLRKRHNKVKKAKILFGTAAVIYTSVVIFFIFSS